MVLFLYLVNKDKLRRKKTREIEIYRNVFFLFTFRLNVDMLYIFQGTFYITEYQLASILLKGLV